VHFVRRLLFDQLRAVWLYIDAVYLSVRTVSSALSVILASNFFDYFVARVCGRVESVVLITHCPVLTASCHL